MWLQNLSQRVFHRYCRSTWATRE